MPLSQFKKSVSYALLAAGLVFAAQAQAVTVDFQVKSSWADGYSSDVIITNDTSKPIDGWILNLAMGHALKSVSRANVTATDPYIFTPIFQCCRFGHPDYRKFAGAIGKVVARGF